MLAIDKYFNNGSFCILPFIHQEKNFDGTYQICCYSSTAQSDNPDQNSIESFNSEHMQSIRQSMITGHKHRSCQSCYAAEDQGLTSPRQHESQTWKNWINPHPALEKVFTDFHSNRQLTPISYDLRYSSTCTLKCRMCNSGSSSAINTEYKKIQSQWPEKFWTLQNYRINHDIEVNSEIQKVYLAGGEPLVEPYNLDILTRLADANPDLNIVINTSLSNVSDKFKVVLDRFNYLTLAISIDGVGVLNDYVRNGSDFGTVMKNIEKLRHHEILFTTCVSLYNIFGINSLVKFIAENYSDCIQHNITLVNGISELQLENTPPELRSAVIDDLNQCLTWKLPNNADTGIKNLITILKYDNFDPTQFKNFIRYTKILDESRKESVSAVIPELAPYFID
jgi:pyruvate-formate lyase-activating enzyme